MPPVAGPGRVVEIDLSAVSVGRRGALTPTAIFIGLLLWFLLLVVLGISGGARAAIFAGVVTVAVIFIGFVATSIQRMSSSTTGWTSAFIEPQDTGRRLPPFDRPLGEIVGRVAAFRADAPQPDIAKADPARRSKRIRATLYVVLGLLIVLLGIPLAIAARLSGALLGIVVLLLCGAMYAMFTRARRIMAPSADLVAAHDPRPPVLFLRSFQDDRITLKQRVSLLGAPVEQDIRFEESLGLMLRGFGPFLAVGEPGEGLPQLGAARAYLSDDRWQEAVLSWIKSARVVVMVAGPTPWIRWELQHVAREERLKDLLLLLPPGRAANAIDRRLERWANIVEAFADTRYEPLLKQIDARDTLLVQFRPDGTILAYHSRHELAQDYELAVTLAAYAVLAEPDLTEVEGTPAPRNARADVSATGVEGSPRPAIVRETGVRAIGVWLMVQGIVFIALFIPFIRYLMQFPGNYRSPGTWLILNCLLLLGAATAGIGLGAFMKRRRFRLAGLIVCAIGIPVFLLLTLEVVMKGRVRPQEIVMAFSPVFALGYLTALVLLWRWRPEQPK